MVTSALTTTQAAEILGSSRQHVADLADRGELRSWRAGSHRRFLRDEVMTYLARLRGGEGTEHR